MDGREVYNEPLGSVESWVTKDLFLPENDRPAKLTVSLLAHDGKNLASGNTELKVPRKLTFYFVSFSHQDLGCGDYPFRRRTRVRHNHILTSLEHFRQSDSWDPDSRFRFVVETSEGITSFLSMHDADVIEEFQRRIREGRVQIGSLLGTANTEQLGHECMARQFYLANRHTCDLLAVPPGKAAVLTDVLGMTWPLATFCKSAGVALIHGHNGNFSTCLVEPGREDLSYWLAPDGVSRILLRHKRYGRVRLERGLDDRVRALVSNPGLYDDHLIVGGADFTPPNFDAARFIHGWNARYAFPRVVCSTLDMFLDAIAEKKPNYPVKVVEGDGNNEWVSQDPQDARALAKIRHAGEMVPTAEKFSTIASVLTPGGYPWTDIYQAYHRMLLWHEHTNGAEAQLCHGEEGTRYYETELEENREMARDALHFGNRAIHAALGRLSAAIPTGKSGALAVFNPLGRVRTDLVSVRADLLPGNFRLVDSVSGKTVEHQVVDGSVIFVAPDVPAMGYRTFGIEPVKTERKADTVSEVLEMENRFYKMKFDGRKGGIISLFDKELDVELVDNSAPNQFNSYLYERLLEDRVGSNKWYGPRKESCGYREGPVARYMDIHSAAEGVNSLKQRVILYNALKRVDFVMEMDKAPSGMTLEHYAARKQINKEAVYVALPFAVPDFTIRHELPGAVIEPYRQNMKGSCTSYFAVRHFSDMSNDRFGVTVSSLEASLFEYGHPRSHPMQWKGWHKFGTSLEYPAHSRMYLYLMNNMWNMNMNVDQPGPHRFRYSLRSHKGNWQEGKADQFGWDIHNPLAARVLGANQKGSLPEDQESFVAVEPANVRCTTIKPAEHNGSGLIVRLVETGGKAAEAEVSLPFLGRIESARETNLVEVDKPGSIAVKDGRSFRIGLPPFGVRTVRVLCGKAGGPGAVSQVTAKAVSDMEISLSWQVDPEALKKISHFNVYRGTKADFKPTLLNLVKRSPVASCMDRPILHWGGWINNRLYPDTKYYYRIAAVDRWHNQGPLSEALKAQTLKPEQKNMVPLKVERLSAIHVTPLAPFNFVNLLFRTSCEPDIEAYEIHRSTEAGFVPDDSTQIGEVRSDFVDDGWKGHRAQDPYPVKDYDHAIFADKAVEPDTTYYYRVCPIDAAGQKGPFSNEASVKTGEAEPADKKD